MIRPRLISFTFDGSEPCALPLDIAAVPPDSVCVFDSWFTVIVHVGAHVAGWVKQVLPSYRHPHSCPLCVATTLLCYYSIMIIF
jgi:hypothetical protein